MNYNQAKAINYRTLFNSAEFLGALTHKEFDRLYYNGSSVMRAIPMPPVPTLLEMYKPGLTPDLVRQRTEAFMAKMQAEINSGRERRGECVRCGEKPREGFSRCPNGHFVPRD